MTLQELLQNEPYLQTDEKMTGIYLVPCGKFGFTSFPVGKTEQVKKTRKRELPADFVMPEGISKEEQAQIENEEYVEDVFTLNENAVLVKIEDYEALLSRKKCWSNGKLVACVKSKVVADAETLLASVEDARQSLADAQQWLNEHDYVGVKIAQAMLIGDEAELAAMKEQYASVIEEAKVKRNEVNAYTKWLNDNEAAIQAAQEVISNEN